MRHSTPSFITKSRARRSGQAAKSSTFQIKSNQRREPALDPPQVHVLPYVGRTLVPHELLERGECGLTHFLGSG